MKNGNLITRSSQMKSIQVTFHHTTTQLALQKLLPQVSKIINICFDHLATFSVTLLLQIV